MDAHSNRLAPASVAAGIAASMVIILVLAVFVGIAACIVGVVGIFRLGPETAALRQSAIHSIGGTWNKKIAVHAGGLAFGLARLGLHWAPLDPEPRAVLSAVRGAEVGIYELEGSPRDLRGGVTLAAADNAMARRRWSRVVGVRKGSDLVAVYVPDQMASAKQIKCCVMVVHEGQLVVVSAQGNLQPVMALAERHLDFKHDMPWPRLQ